MTVGRYHQGQAVAVLVTVIWDILSEGDPLLAFLAGCQYQKGRGVASIVALVTCNVSNGQL